MTETPNPNESGYVTYEEQTPHTQQVGDHPDRHLKERSRHLAQDAIGEFVDRANEAGARTMKVVGHKLEDIARRIEPEQLPSQVEPEAERARSAGVARSLTGAARYLEEHDPKSVAVDIDNSIQRHPYRALGICFGVGWLIGRLARRS